MYRTMSCILIRYNNDQKFGDDPFISSGVIPLFVFSALAPWWPRQESDWTETWSVSVIRPGGTYVQSLRSIAQS
jgi:hypothetical protein